MHKNDDDMFEHEDEDVNKLDWQQIFLQEKMMGEPQSIPQSIIYELVNETINKEAFNISCPRGKDLTIQNLLKYLALMPLTHTQYFTIPSPLSKRNDNYYPLTLFISIIWIWAYAYVIVWFTYDITTSVLGSKFSLIPMFIYPIGVSFRDMKKF